MALSIGKNFTAKVKSFFNYIIVGVNICPKIKTKNLSGESRQKVVLAKRLVKNKKVLIFTRL